jgi:hypothetical protein
MTFDLVELLKYLEVDGSTAIFAIFVVFLIWTMMSNSKAANLIRTTVVNRVSNTISTIHTNKERLSEQISADIDEVLENLQEESDANNVLIVRFRNGSYDSVGSSILKFFASNEKTKPGYYMIGDKIQDVSRSLYGNFCDSLIKEKKVYIRDRASLKGHPNEAELTGILNLFGNAEKFYARALTTTKKGLHIGFICAVYTSEPHRISETKLDLLVSEAGARVVGKIEMENLSSIKTIAKKSKDKSEE